MVGMKQNFTVLLVVVKDISATLKQIASNRNSVISAPTTVAVKINGLPGLAGPGSPFFSSLLIVVCVFCGLLSLLTIWNRVIVPPFLDTGEQGQENKIERGDGKCAKK